MVEPLSARFRALLAPLAQLTVLAGVAWGLGLEEAAGLPVALVIGIVGWVVHELAQPWWKPRVFLGIALAVFGWRLGWDAAFVVCAGLVLSEITVLPLGLPWRIGLLLFAGAEIAWARLRYGDVLVSDAALALLGSMFMFRSVLVLLDRDAAMAGRMQRWTYFFQWPNALFLLYPVVDWQAWTRPPSTPPAALHRRGVRWIARGFSHLLVYRLVYHLVLPADWEIEDASGLLWWMLGSFGLYVRISGVFHIAVGLLLLFGKDLPRTQNRYFLASSFSDHYRRVNIYWTAFLEQMVFLPAWFGLRRRGVPVAHVVAVLPTFAASWALHHWQSFWIAGRMHVTATDTTFWAILGLLVTANTAWATSRPARRRRPAYLLHAAKVVGTFSAMTLLWSLWKSETFDLWFARMRLLLDEPQALLALLAVLGCAVLAGAAAQWALDQGAVKAALARLPRGSLPACAALAVLALALQPALPQRAPRWVAQARSALAAEHLSLGDEVAKTHGYYDDLGPMRVVDPAALAKPPPSWGKFRDTPLARPTGKDVPYEFELVPGARGLFRGLPFTINSHGMRDKEYSVDKPPGTYRIALLGASPEVGEGVSDDEVFSVLVEDQLNQTYGRPDRRFEILNFAAGSRTLDAAVIVYQRKVRAFQPDLVLVADHTSDEPRLMARLERATRAGRLFPGEVGPRVAEGIEHLSPALASAKLLPQGPAVIREMYELLVRDITGDGAKVVWLFVPVPVDLDRPRPWQLDRREQGAIAAGMISINLEGAYGQRTRKELEVAPWDNHPNALGHRLLAERLLQELVARDAELGLGLSPP